MFDLIFKENMGQADRERLKQASKSLLASLRGLLRPMQAWTEKAQTQAEVRMFITDNLYRALPRPPFSDEETDQIAGRVYDFVLQRSVGGQDLMAG